MDSDEDIELFLIRLKLSEKYLDLFKQNGYTTISKCKTLTEDDLKKIGVTLPGHYKRIVSSLAKEKPAKLISVLSSPMLIDEVGGNTEEDNPYETETKSLPLPTNIVISELPSSTSPKKQQPSKPPRSKCRLSPRSPLSSNFSSTVNDIIAASEQPSPDKNVFTFSSNVYPLPEPQDDSGSESPEDIPSLPAPPTPTEASSLMDDAFSSPFVDSEYDTLSLDVSGYKKPSDMGYGSLGVPIKPPRSRSHSGSSHSPLTPPLSSPVIMASGDSYEDVVILKTDKSHSSEEEYKDDNESEEVKGLQKSAETALLKRHKLPSVSTHMPLPSPPPPQDGEEEEQEEAIYEECLDKEEASSPDEDIYEDADQVDVKESATSSSPNILSDRKFQSLSRKSPVIKRKTTRIAVESKPTNPTQQRLEESDDSQEEYAEIDFGEKAITAAKPPTPVARRKRDQPMPQRPISVFSSASHFNEPSVNDDRIRTYSATIDRATLSLSKASTDKTPLLSPQTKMKTKSGWLMKHGGHDGRAPLRKRWVVFNGEELTYYESESKLDISKGIVPVESMVRVQPDPKDPLTFNVHVTGGRKYIFQADKSDERNVWASTLFAAVMQYEKQPHQFKPGGVKMFMPYKQGYLKMEGFRTKVYLATKGEYIAYYKNENEFTVAQPISRLKMKLATVKDTDRKKFQIIFPFRSFTFTAENEEEKCAWVECLNDAIAEGLSDDEVLHKVWKNKSNTHCADCGRESPDWASINLSIVICKHCAGVHRELGVQNSKVRSLRMDINVWTPAMIQVLQDVGNRTANDFWCAHLSASETISDMTDKQQRNWFINTKYIEMKYAERFSAEQDVLNERLVAAIRDDDNRIFYSSVFGGADVNCATGKEHAATPYLYARHLKRVTFVEILKQNGATNEINSAPYIQKRPSIPNVNLTHKSKKPPVCLRDVLDKYGGDFKKNQTEDKRRLALTIPRGREFQKRLCILENQELKYCDPDKPLIVKDQFPCKEIISIGSIIPELAKKAGYQYGFEVSRKSGRTYLFCTDKEEKRIKWTRGLMQAIVPPHIQDHLGVEEDFERVGWLNMRSQGWKSSSATWSDTMCRLCGKQLQYFHNEARSVERIDLRKVVQITYDQTNDALQNKLPNSVQNKETIPIIMLVFKEKSYHFQSSTKSDSESWMTAIQTSDCNSGASLDTQQLTTEGVPILLEKCTTFIEQFGLESRGIYRLSGTHSKTTQLLDSFRRNARETQMKEGEIHENDVANALKRWFKSLPGSLFTVKLHKEWIDASQIKPEFHNQKLEWYKHLLGKLPEINRVTLKLMLMHLKKVADLKNANDMSAHNLAIVFGPTLMEPASETESDANNNFGDTSQEINCVEDLLNYYDWLFDVTESDRDKERMLQEAKDKISMATQQQQHLLTTLDYEMMVPIYINKKVGKCVNHKVNLTAMELVYKICLQYGYPKSKWGLFEVICDGDAERPIHYTEHVLTVIKAWKLPSTNYLVVKNDYFRDKMRWFKTSVPEDVSVLLETPLRMYSAGKKKWVKIVASLVRELDGVFNFKYIKTSDLNSNSNLGGPNWRKKSIRTHVLSKTNIPWLSNVASDEGKVPASLNVSSFKVYTGVDRKTKPAGSGKQGFTVIPFNEAAIYFCADIENDMYRWVSYFLLLMHQDGYTPPVSEINTPIDGSPMSTSRSSSQSNSLVRNLHPLSQQELGSALQQRLNRTSSTDSADSLSVHQYTNQLQSNPETVTSETEQIYESAEEVTSVTSNLGRRPSGRQSGFSEGRRMTGNMNLRLHDELSTVLKKRPH